MTDRRRTVAADIGRNPARTVAHGRRVQCCRIGCGVRWWQLAHGRRIGCATVERLPDRLATNPAARLPRSMFATVERLPDCRTACADCIANGARTACKTHGAFQTGADMSGTADGLQGRFRWTGDESGQTSRYWRERLPRLQGGRVAVARAACGIRRHWPESGAARLSHVGTLVPFCPWDIVGHCGKTFVPRGDACPAPSIHPSVRSSVHSFIHPKYKYRSVIVPYRMAERWRSGFYLLLGRLPLIADRWRRVRCSPRSPDRLRTVAGMTDRPEARTVAALPESLAHGGDESGGKVLPRHV